MVAAIGAPIQITFTHRGATPKRPPLAESCKARQSSDATVPTATASCKRHSPLASRSIGRVVQFSSNTTSILIPKKEELDILDIYYTRHELYKMVDKARWEADKVYCRNPQVVEKMDRIFEAGAFSPSSSTEADDDEHSLFSSSSSSSSFSILQGNNTGSLASLYEYSARGLERFLSDLQGHYRREAIGRILQEARNKGASQNLDSLLRMRSLAASRNARCFAERMAAADAAEAQVVYDEIEV